ncbi:MAG: response regulator [Proteobacteria bacterium]|nr:response regulator [Pseudomonadota bacterium]
MLPGDGDESPSTLAEEVRSGFDYQPIALTGYVAGVAVITSLFWGAAQGALLGSWAGVFLAVLLARFGMVWRFRHAVARGAIDWPRWRLASNAATLLTAALWGLTGWIFYLRGNAIEQTGLVIVVYTFCVAAVPVLSVQPRLYVAYAVLCFAPMILRIAGVGGYDNYLLAFEVAVIIIMTAMLARNYRQTLRRVLSLKRRADRLVQQVRVEKQAADAARQQAEVANRAKTQFFTAASHDLRQPLHAMGLFAEALRQRVHAPAGPPQGRVPEGEARRVLDDPEVAQLVNSINESVDALEGLFSELLDITRIDAGGIEVHRESFAMGDILRKLRLHFEPSAFEKGLALRLRGALRVVDADPLLVERILRNLVSNAIRYTNDGSVLVSCRARGSRVIVQVWDTGLGIREQEQAKIFEEFYQVPNRPEIAPHQRKGLGLGLAIVKRLADLMDAPLTLRSQPGRGTVFTLDLPAGTAPRPRAQALPGKGPTGLTLDGRRIVIVEDEPAVRAGLEVLLHGWGATLESFDSVAACAVWADAAAQAGVRPDLLIVDYRLEEGQTGVDAIVAMRRRFGREVPAIVVTGSTMTGHDRDAQEHDFHLLLKPVVPNKLRAMIAFKLGVKPGG